MPVDSETKPRRGRPRDPELDGRVILATQEAAGELGLHRVNLALIAERAGVGKPSIYLRWENRDAVVAEAIRLALQGASDVREIADAIDALEAVEASHGRFLAEVLAGPSTRRQVKELLDH